ncbi:MAG: hypothetical protein MSS97_06145 [Arcanobacterium sp.]|nr:hypothetical protein [Arcanobacterium sp.]MDY6143814.1 hypothetical protein [Arcanobacterium sp.]
MHTDLLTAYSEPHLHAATYTHSSGGTRNPYENHVLLNTKIQRQWNRIETIAAELTWRGRALDGDPAKFIASRLQWAEKNYPYMQDLETLITEIHTTYQQLLREDPQPTTYLCPLCGRAQLRYRERDRIYLCPNETCEGAWTLPQLQALRHYRILSAGQWIAVQEAARRYNLKPATIRQWIHRHKLERNTRGEINTAQLEQLW